MYRLTQIRYHHFSFTRIVAPHSHLMSLTHSSLFDELNEEEEEGGEESSSSSAASLSPSAIAPDSHTASASSVSTLRAEHLSQLQLPAHTPLAKYMTHKLTGKTEQETEQTTANGETEDGNNKTIQEEDENSTSSSSSSVSPSPSPLLLLLFILLEFLCPALSHSFFASSTLSRRSRRWCVQLVSQAARTEQGTAHREQTQTPDSADCHSRWKQQIKQQSKWMQRIYGAAIVLAACQFIICSVQLVIFFTIQLVHQLPLASLLHSLLSFFSSSSSLSSSSSSSPVDSVQLMPVFYLFASLVAAWNMYVAYVSNDKKKQCTCLIHSAVAQHSAATLLFLLFLI